MLNYDWDERIHLIPRSNPVHESTGFDFGILEKIFDAENGVYVLIAAGWGFAGTMSAAYYLSQNWELLEKRFGSSPFALCLKVPWHHKNVQGYKSPQIIFSEAT